MTDTIITNLCMDEYSDVDVPAHIKSDVLQSIAYLSLIQSILELYGSMFDSVALGSIYNDESRAANN
jgi:hypothetical protein